MQQVFSLRWASTATRSRRAVNELNGGIVLIREFIHGSEHPRFTLGSCANSTGADWDKCTDACINVLLIKCMLVWGSISVHECLCECVGMCTHRPTLMYACIYGCIHEQPERPGVSEIKTVKNALAMKRRHLLQRSGDALYIIIRPAYEVTVVP